MLLGRFFAALSCLAIAGGFASASTTPPLFQSPAEQALEKARALEKTGDVALARDAWLEAGLAFPPGVEREDCVGRSRALDMRSVLRREVREGFGRDQVVFGELGVLDATEAGLKTKERLVPWNEAPLDLLQRAAAAVRASNQARIGLVHEALARGSAKEKDEALVALSKLLEKKAISEVDAFAAIARTRGETVPVRGYVFEKGKWTSVDAAAQAAEEANLEALVLRFEVANAAQRDPLLRELEALGAPADERIARSLEARWAAAIERLGKGGTLKELTLLAAQRTELDLRRKAALDLIFDEERYFYPYDPPECPPEKAKLYAGVQQEVDTLVSRVRDAWKAGRRVKPAPAFLDALDELEWNRRVQSSRKLVFARPDSLPAWIDGIDPALDTLDLASFAWSSEERAELARGRAVQAFNERRWKHGEFDGPSAAETDEQRQVNITNDYRRMLGRPVLAWNSKIQAAAQGHSDYMANTGDFGHDEPDPKRKWPGDRMRLEGYTSGVSENCAMREGAEGAHVGWTHSSGHHRNLLEAGHREMASAAAGDYWTQNFGTGTEFLKELGAPTRP